MIEGTMKCYKCGKRSYPCVSRSSPHPLVHAQTAHNILLSITLLSGDPGLLGPRPSGV
jgi:hypothetical protein